MSTRRPSFIAAARLSQEAIGTVGPGPARYWRLFVTATQTGGTGPNDNFSVAEIAMRATAGGNNESAGKVYASSTELSPTSNADAAFDGNALTALETTESTNAWVSVDFGVGNDIEIQEIVYTTPAGVTRQQPTQIRVEYSADNLVWFLAWIVVPTAWLTPQETRTFTAPYAESLFPVTNFATVSNNLTPVAGWGVVLRNYNYTGPALEVEDNANPGTKQDIPFDSNGFITADLPYGTNTRVVRVYDQFGNSDLFATLAKNITPRKNDTIYGTWLLRINGNGGLSTTDVTGGGVPWELGNPVFCGGMIRERSGGFTSVFGINNELEVNTNQEDVQWVINNQNSGDWTGTDFFADAFALRGKIGRYIGDCSLGSPAKAYFRGETANTLSYTAPIVYTPGEPVYVGEGLGPNIFTGWFTEYTIFATAGAPSTEEITKLDEALQEPEFFLTSETTATFEHRIHTVVGGPRPDTTISKNQNAHVVLGPKFSSVNAHTQRVAAVFGPKYNGISAHSPGTYVVVVP